MKIEMNPASNLPDNHREIIRDFPKLIEPMVKTLLDAPEVKQHPAAMAMAAIAAGRDVLSELWAPEFAIIALKMAINGLVEEHPELAQLLDPVPAAAPSSGTLQ